MHFIDFAIKPTKCFLHIHTYIYILLIEKEGFINEKPK